MQGELVEGLDGRSLPALPHPVALGEHMVGEPGTKGIFFRATAPVRFWKGMHLNFHRGGQSSVLLTKKTILTVSFRGWLSDTTLFAARAGKITAEDHVPAFSDISTGSFQPVKQVMTHRTICD